MTATGNHMLPGTAVTFLAIFRFYPSLPQPKLILDLATPEGCKAELSKKSTEISMECRRMIQSMSDL